MKNDELQVRLTGKGIKPGLIRSKELAEILESVDALVTAEVLKRRGEDISNRDYLIVGLYAIDDHSIGLKFKTTLASIVIPIFLSTALAIGNGKFESLDTRTIKSLQTISRFTRKHNCNAEFVLPGKESLAKITPETEIPEPFLIEGVSEILGKVVRVGGKTPRAMIELTDGTTIYCDIPEKMAKELGRRLYSLVKLTGTARWNFYTYDLEEFRIADFTEFPNIPPNEMFESLAKNIGECFSGITDVRSFVTDLRREGDAV
uniref:Uncharacterized protein n=1 Tax=Candidatus Kentrum sp. UNK TaxID=2126344 RepID=A0A451ALS9_9GAMM|nr:MAG: hypothetical protein BECKUNK1418G_GA0071005_11206 [Candidatus Kentron sp. UNK]VFK72473.1 MAG: hypothetical protein BECKUNK1418H_GA0071006_11176 [Candidatus Kentron sp. UNK]